MNNPAWKDVTVVFADGSTRPAKAAYAGEGWCDVIVDHDNYAARFWAKSDGTVDLPMNPVRLEKPFNQYC